MASEQRRRLAFARSLIYGAGNSVLEAISPSPDSFTYAIAPHTVHFMDCGFMAINKFCIAKVKVLRESEPQDVMDHKIVDLPEHTNFYGSLEVIRNLLKVMQLQKCYEIHVINPFDVNENFAIIPVLIAIIRAIKPIENGGMERALLEHSLRDQEIPCKEAIIEATLHGSLQKIHFPKITEPIFQMGICNVDRPTATIKAFHRKHDMIFIRTNRHPSQFRPQLRPSERNTTDLRQRFLDEPAPEEMDDFFASWKVADGLTAFSQSRLVQRESSQIEKDCSTALGRLLRQEVVGFEVQQGGCVVLVKKGEFQEPRVLRSIANAIASQTELALSELSFHLLKPANGAEQLTEQDAIHLERQEWADATF